MDDAECNYAPDPDIFFPSQPHALPIIAEAQAYCWRCPVSDQCMEYALKYQIKDGIFAGLLPEQRRSILRRRSREGVSERP